MSDDLFDQFGLPKELNVGDDIAKENLTITVSVVKKKFGKAYTIIEGLDDVDVKDIQKKLKAKFACGGTYRDKVIELQGDHRSKMKEALAKLGFSSETIHVK